MPVTLGLVPTRPACNACQNAYTILCNARDSAASFLDTFTTVRRDRSARGTPTDEEQDLLRAMLLFAASGLDSAAKQLVEDALHVVIQNSAGADEMFRKFVQRKLTSEGTLNRRLVADVLTAQAPRTKLIGMLVQELGSGSLQSTEEVLRVASFFDIPSERISSDPRELSAIFDARNEIVHEMDVDFSQPNRNRRPRARDPMVAWTNTLLETAEKFLAEVDSRIR